MFSKVQNRKFKFEVMVRQEGRWIIEAISEKENDAKLIACSYVARAGVEQVKVVQHRTMLVSGFTSKKVIFDEPGKPPEEKDFLSLSGGAHGCPMCMNEVDFFRFEARKIMRRMLKAFLQRHTITASELLYSWQWQRKLQDAGQLVNSALYVVAREQMGADGSVKERAVVLGKMVTKLERMARDYPAERHHIPDFDENNVMEVAQKIEKRVGKEDAPRFLMAAACDKIGSVSSYFGKLGIIVTALKQNPPAWIFKPLKSLMADLLMEQDTLRDLFTGHACRGAFLLKFADYLAGRDEIEGKELEAIGVFLSKGIAQQTRQVLLGHLMREITARAPLDKREPEADEIWMERLLPKMRLANGQIMGGAEMEIALSKRMMWIQQDRLRRMGLQEAADSLPDSWQSPFTATTFDHHDTDDEEKVG